MAIEGTLELFHLPEILQMVSAQGKTGILTIQGENDIVAISFKDGQVVAADALNQTVEEGLGQVLASQGLVSPSDFTRVSAEHEASGKRLLDLLLERGLLDRGQLLDALRTQTYQLLLQLLRWEQGEFKFYSGDEVAFEEGFYAISVEELLIRSVSDLGDGEPGGVLPELDETYESIPGGAPVKIIGRDGNGPMDDSSAVWLAPEEEVLLGRIDGTTPTAKIAEETGMGEYKVLFALYRLLRGGAVRRAVRRTAPAPAPASPPLAPVELPEEHVYEEARRMSVGRAPEPREPEPLSNRSGQWATLLARLLAVAGLLAVLAVPFHAWSGLLLPLAWQQDLRAHVERDQRTSLYERIDRAARTYFLLEGHFPDELLELVEVRVLPMHALHDPEGHFLAYSTDDVTYALQPMEGGEPVQQLSVREGIGGDFLLDPEFLNLPQGAEKAPLVLLD